MWQDGPSPEGPRPPRRGPSGGAMIREDCPNCEGRGYVRGFTIEDEFHDCEMCGGTGEIETEDCREDD